jgi:hypothetical protein
MKITIGDSSVVGTCNECDRGTDDARNIYIIEIGNMKLRLCIHCMEALLAEMDSKITLHYDWIGKKT